MTKSVCTGTRAIVKTLPSGHISEEIWEVVVVRGRWRPSKKDISPILTRGAREEPSVCREMIRFLGLKLQKVRE